MLPPGWTPAVGGQAKGPAGSLQERTLKVKLKIGHRTGVSPKEAAQVLNALQQGVCLQAGGRLLLQAQDRAQPGQLPPQAVQQVIEGLLGKGQPQRLESSLDGTALQQPPQPGPQRRCPHGVAGQHLGQEDRKTSPTAAPLAPVGAPDPLATLNLAALGAGRVVAEEPAVVVQGFGSSAKGAAELLGQKRCSVNSLSSRTKR
jgi:hypothetical protein